MKEDRPMQCEKYSLDTTNLSPFQRYGSNIYIVYVQLYTCNIQYILTVIYHAVHDTRHVNVYSQLRSCLN